MDKAKAAAILADLESGKSLRASAKAAGIDESTARRWFEKPALAPQYARARELGYKALADELVDIADDSSGDVVFDEDGRPKMDGEFAARSRLRVDTRKWLLSKMLPKVYGERINHEVTGGITVTLTPKDAEL